MDEAERRRRQASRQSREEDHRRPRLGREDEGGLHRRPASPSSAPAGAGSRSRTARSPSPRRRTARTRWCTAASRSSAATCGSTPTTSTIATGGRTTQGLPRSSGQLGIRRQDVRCGDDKNVGRGLSADRRRSESRARQFDERRCLAHLARSPSDARHDRAAAESRHNRPDRTPSCDTADLRAAPTPASSDALPIGSRSRCSRSRRASRSLTFRDYGLAGTTTPIPNTATSCSRSTPRACATSARCPSSISTMYGGGFDLLAALAAKVLAVHAVRDAPARRRGGRHPRAVRDLAHRPAHRRAARRADRARAAGDLPALCTATCS